MLNRLTVLQEKNWNENKQFFIFLFLTILSIQVLEAQNLKQKSCVSTIYDEQSKNLSNLDTLSKSLYRRHSENSIKIFFKIYLDDSIKIKVNDSSIFQGIPKRVNIGSSNIRFLLEKANNDSIEIFSNSKLFLKEKIEKVRFQFLIIAFKEKSNCWIFKFTNRYPLFE